MLKNWQIDKKEFKKSSSWQEIVQDGAMQRNFPPTPGVQVASFMQPLARFIGGDFFRFLRHRDPKKLGILIGDVCGKGIPAALIMAVMVSLFRGKVFQDHRTR